MPKQNSRTDPLILFWRHVDPCRTDGEMLWVGYVHKWGYGHFAPNGKKVYAHRWLYERVIGPVPIGLDLDHVRERGCTHRNCVNVWEHLEPVTRTENVLRGKGPYGVHQRHRAITHCPKGHPYDLLNTRLKEVTKANGVRYISRCCRTCDHISSAAHNAKRRH